MNGCQIEISMLVWRKVHAGLKCGHRRKSTCAPEHNWKKSSVHKKIQWEMAEGSYERTLNETG